MKMVIKNSLIFMKMKTGVNNKIIIKNNLKFDFKLFIIIKHLPLM